MAGLNTLEKSDFLASNQTPIIR